MELGRTSFYECVKEGLRMSDRTQYGFVLWNPTVARDGITGHCRVSHVLGAVPRGPVMPNIVLVRIG